jgi:uncharacterized protein (DUF2141 family)
MLSLAFAAVMFAAQPGTVTVQFTGLIPDKGTVMVQLCEAAEFSTFTCRRRQGITVKGNTVTAVFDNIPAGRYAVTAFQDENLDGRLGRNLMGMPTEPWAFSGKPEFMMGPPSFDSVAIDIPASGKSLSLKMQK